MTPVCGVCEENVSKYKCPICELRYCSLRCYKLHKSLHESDQGQANIEQSTRQLRDRPGTTQRIPQVDFTGFENDKEFQRLLSRYPSLRIQLQAVYALTLEPGPEHARTWNRGPLPGVPSTHLSSSRASRGRGRGRGRDTRSHRGSRSDNTTVSDREHGMWTQAKGDKEALTVIKKMRADGTNHDELVEGMKEFIELCQMRFGEDAST